MTPGASIIILTHNGWPYTKVCLAGISRYTRVPYEVIVVDNGSTDATLPQLRKLHKSGKIRLLENDINRGFAAGMNQGMRATEKKFIVLLNNDTVPSYRWLDNPLALLARFHNVGIVGPVSNRVIQPQKVKTHVTSLKDIHTFSQKHNRLDPRKWYQTSALSGFCMIFPRKLVQQIGELDERFGAGTCEDVDYCMRAIKAGYTCGVSGDTYVHHFGNRTFKQRDKIEYQKILKQNRQFYRYKWGKKPVG